MISVYLLCLIVGGGLLLFSLVGGVDGADADADVDAGADGDWGGMREFLSIRALFYFLAGFGATGTLLERFTTTPSTNAFFFALLIGALAAAAVGAVYGWLRASESGVVSLDNDYLIGLPARVILPVVHGHRGKVRLLSRGREIELLARLHGVEDADCMRGDTVVIVEVDGDTALVAPAPSLPPDSF